MLLVISYALTLGLKMKIIYFQLFNSDCSCWGDSSFVAAQSLLITALFAILQFKLICCNCVQDGLLQLLLLVLFIC